MQLQNDLNVAITFYCIGKPVINKNGTWYLA